MKGSVREKKKEKILERCQMPGEGERVNQSWPQGKGIFQIGPLFSSPGLGPGLV